MCYARFDASTTLRVQRPYPPNIYAQVNMQCVRPSQRAYARLMLLKYLRTHATFSKSSLRGCRTVGYLHNGLSVAGCSSGDGTAPHVHRQRQRSRVAGRRQGTFTQAAFGWFVRRILFLGGASELSPSRRGGSARSWHLPSLLSARQPSEHHMYAARRAGHHAGLGAACFRLCFQFRKCGIHDTIEHAACVDGVLAI